MKSKGVFDMSGIIGLLEGRVRIFADESNREKLVSFFIENGIRAKTEFDIESGGIYTEVSPSLLKKIAPSLDKSGIIVYIINICGFKYLKNLLMSRLGLAVGAMIFVAVLWISTLFVWRVDVIGNESLTKEQLRQTLFEYGVKEGAIISDIDEKAVSNAIVSISGEISWAALNVKGTTVTLTVRETALPSDKHDELPPMMVAKKSGVVRSVELYSGKSAVKVGSIVKEGDLLISGFISGNGLQYSDTPGIRYEGASGSVRAEVLETAEIFVPFESENEKTVLGDISGLVLEVFGNRITIGKSDGDGEARRVTFFGDIELPVTYFVAHFSDTVTEKQTFSPEEASLQAERLIYGKIIEMCGDGDLTSVSVSYSEGEKGITASAKVTYVTEIAVGKNIGRNS